MPRADSNSKSLLKQLYGPGIGEQLGARSNESMPPPLDPDEDPGVDAPGGMELRLKRRRQASILKQILKQGGYGDLARIASFHKD